MAEEKKKVFRKNLVRVEGYLKENNLKIVHDSKGNEAISGSVIVALDSTKAHKVQVYVNRLKKDGTANKDYEGFASILPTNTISVAAYIQSNGEATAEAAYAQATKVWMTSELEEFVTKNDEGNDIGYITLKGKKAGIKSATDKVPFTPQARFDIDMYIKSIRREVKGDDETGRLDLVGLIPHWSGTMQEVSFKVSGEKIKNPATGEELVISDYIESNYSEGQTANFTGSIINLEVESQTASTGWGDAPVSNSTTFVRERVITGGHGAGLDEDNPGAIHEEEVREGLINRAAKREENYKKSLERKSAADNGSAVGFDTGFTGFAPAPAAPAAAGEGFSFDESDF